MRLTSIVLLFVALIAGGCSNPLRATLNAEGLDTTMLAKNEATFDTEAVQMRVSNPSIPGIPVMVDNGEGRGVWGTLAGTANAMQLGDASLATTSDIEAEEIVMRANGDIEVRGLRVSASTATAAFDVQVTTTIDAIRQMNADEARRYVDSLVATGQIAASVGELIIKAHTGGVLP